MDSNIAYIIQTENWKWTVAEIVGLSTYVIEEDISLFADAIALAKQRGYDDNHIKVEFLKRGDSEKEGN